MTDTTRRARTAARSSEFVARPDWKPAKITFEERFNLPSGGRITRRISLPAISMHMDLCKEAGRAFEGPRREAAR